MKRNILILTWIAVFECVGAIFGIITKNNIHSWYSYLNKSILTPPPILFSIVWPTLYAIIAYVGFRIWESRKQPNMAFLIALYLIQVLLNWIWTPLFFQLHWIDISYFLIIMLTIVTLIITIQLRKFSKNLSYLFFIYFLWLIFASYLNGVIYFTN